MNKERATSWTILGIMLSIVGVLVIIWVTTYTKVTEADRAAGQPANLPFADLTNQFQQFGEILDKKIGGLHDLFNQKEVAPMDTDDQNNGLTGQQTNAGLSNEEITQIEQKLFANTAPQQ